MPSIIKPPFHVSHRGDYLMDADKAVIAVSVSPEPQDKQMLVELAQLANGNPEAAIAALFATMPIPPDDMASLDGLTAYAEATLEWRARMGYPAEYDGPVGPSEAT